VIGADADPSYIVVDVVDAIGHGAAQLGIDEVMDVDGFRSAFRTPLPAVVLEIAHEFLLLGVNRNDWLVRGQERLGLRVDVLELRIAIDVFAAFARLAVRTVAHVAQEIANDRRTNLVPPLRQLLYKITQATTRPQKGPHRIPPRRRLDDTLQIRHEGCILGCLVLAPATTPADPSGLG